MSPVLALGPDRLVSTTPAIGGEHPSHLGGVLVAPAEVGEDLDRCDGLSRRALFSRCSHVASVCLIARRGIVKNVWASCGFPTMPVGSLQESQTSRGERWSTSTLNM